MYNRKMLGCLSIVLTLCIPSVAFAWTIHSDFDDGTTGSAADRGNDGFSGAGGLSVYSDDTKLKRNSVKLQITKGDTGFGRWGGSFYFPQKAYRGETIWFLVHTFMPEGFDHYSYGEGGRLKFLRIHTKGSDGSNHGYNDLYFDQKGLDNPLRWIYEGEQKWVPVGGSNDKPVHDKWESYEMAVTLDNKSFNDGGKARIMLWKNEVLLADIKDRITLKAATDYSDTALLFTYWNGGAPKSQHMYVDEVIITNERPSQRDANGNYFLRGFLNTRPLMAP